MLKNILIKFIVASILFVLGCGLFLTQIFVSDNGFGSIDKVENSKLIYVPSGKSLIKNQKIFGEFVAVDDNLGSIKVNFDSLNRLNNDVLIFRIKEKGSSFWYYENDYPVRQFYSLPLYPFGFPIIHNSKNKIYQFEFVSKYGDGKNSVTVSKENPVLISRYTFTKEIITNSTGSLTKFLIKKMVISLNFREKIVLFFLNQYPLYLFIIGTLVKRFLHESKIVEHFLKKAYLLQRIEKRIVLSVYLLGIILEILIIKETNNLLLIILTIISLYISHRFKLNWVYFMRFAIGFIVLSAFSYHLGMIKYSDSLMIWTYIFLLNSTIVLVFNHAFSER